MGKDSAPLPAPEDNAKPHNWQEMFDGRHVVTKFIDPCEDAARVANECLIRTGKRESCLDFFQAYRDCKGTWLEQKRTRHHRKPPQKPLAEPPQPVQQNAPPDAELGKPPVR
ncbi:hypothetical protein BKA62DRAFT_422213 [Auriculariales sp. MPI-PUGE-AT-0066]|nr:hypothetical protein BKA62DRAFT_422213 [Auriculariales sp. MPI-PUGE-AT-0066]